MDADYFDSSMNLSNKLKFFFDDVCKAIGKKFNTTANRYKGKGTKKLDQYFNISIELLENMWEEESSL